MCRAGEDPEIARQQKVVFQLTGRTHCDLQKATELSITSASTPSAMLAPIETAARRIWAVSPYSSSLGKLLVWTYTCSVKRWLRSHTFNRLKSFTFSPSAIDEADS